MVQRVQPWFAEELAALQTRAKKRRRRAITVAAVLTAPILLGALTIWGTREAIEARRVAEWERIAALDSQALFEEAFDSRCVQLDLDMPDNLAATFALQNESRRRGDAMVRTLAAAASSDDDARREFAVALLREIRTPMADSALSDIDTAGLFIKHRIDIVHRIGTAGRPGAAFRRLWADAATPSPALRAVITAELTRMARVRAAELRAAGIPQFVCEAAAAPDIPPEIRAIVPDLSACLREGGDE